MRKHTKNKGRFFVVYEWSLGHLYRQIKSRKIAQDEDTGQIIGVEITECFKKILK